LRAVFTLGNREKQQRKLGLSWQVWVKPWQDVRLRCVCSSWVCVGRTSRRSPSSVNLQGELTNRLLTDVSFVRHHSESPSSISCHSFTDICNCVCVSRGWRAPASSVILKILTPVFKSFKQFKYQLNPVYEREHCRHTPVLSAKKFQ
jgi:hypothetical protein